MLFEKIKNAKECDNWIDSCNLTVDALFSDIEESNDFRIKGYSFSYGSSPFTDDQLLNMSLIVDDMVNNKIWKFDDNTEDAEYASIITQYWLALSIFSIFKSIEIDSSFNLRDYKDFVNKTVIKKQIDYGPNNIARFGLNGLVIRMHDKIARLENLFKNNSKPENESLKDNLLDVIGYSIVAIMWINQTFLLPMRVEGSSR